MLKQNTMQSNEPIGAHALSHFFATFTSSQQHIEEALMILELAPDEQLFTDMLTHIGRIEKSLHELGLDNLTMLTGSLKKLTEELRAEKLSFETLVSDVILLGVNDIKMVIERMIDGATRCVLVDRLPKICASIDRIGEADAVTRHEIIKDALLLLDPSMEIIESRVSHSDTLLNLFSHDSMDTEELLAYGVEESDDFIFFRSLSQPLETRARYWEGRAHRMLRLALQMNDHAGRPVDPEQLAAAVYMHDAGMALLPLDVINSDKSLTDEQLELVKQHPVTAYELMRYMKSWKEAASMVLQHHEQVDGNGYPYGLGGDEICEGAKIIAIVDAVDARTHERAHAMLLKRPLLRAAIELGKHSGTQFSEYWVNVFKEVFQEVRKVRDI